MQDVDHLYQQPQDKTGVFNIILVLGIDGKSMFLINRLRSLAVVQTFARLV